MKFKLIDTKEITDLEIEIGFELVIVERRPKYQDKYYAQFESCDVKGDGVLSSMFGNGQTMDQALKDYCSEISCVTLVFNANSENRKEIQTPKLIHTKLLNK